MKVVVKKGKPAPKTDGKPKEPPFSEGDIVLRRGDLTKYGLPVYKKPDKKAPPVKQEVCAAFFLQVSYPYYVKEVRKDGGLILEGFKYPVSPKHVEKGEYCPKCQKCGLVRSPFLWPDSCAGCWY